MTPQRLGRNPHSAPVHLLAALTALLLALGVAPLAAQTLSCPSSPPSCDRTGCGYVACATPVFSVPQAQWGELQPANGACATAPGDSTSFHDLNLTQSTDFYHSLDIANGYIFNATGYGVQIFNATTTPANPTLIGTLTANQFPFFPVSQEVYDPMASISVPPNVDTEAAVSGSNGDIGIAIIDARNKSHPVVAYQGKIELAFSVYAAHIGSTNYAFLGTETTGVYAFNMDKALAGTPGCVENIATPAGACPGVDLGQVIQGSAFVVAGIGNYLAVTGESNGVLSVYDVSNPMSPNLKLTQSFGLGYSTNGITMWTYGGKYYLATRVGLPGDQSDALYVYDVSCITGSSCPAGGTQLYAQTFQEPTNGGLAVTASLSNGTPFLYMGTTNSCPTGTQEEWLWDMTNPSAPRDVTPPAVDGVGYWGWYYRGNATGFNNVLPQMGKFSPASGTAGSYFYRDAFAAFDVHQWVGATTPTASFGWSPSPPAPIYPNTPVTFTSTSSGGQLAYSWTFPGGSPSTSNQASPTVSFASQASYPATVPVGLTVSNTAGRSSVTNNVTLTNPVPQQAGAGTVSPANPLQCQVVTLTAFATGAPTLGYSVNIVNADNQSMIGGSGTSNPIMWDSSAALAPSGTYTANWTVTNGFGTVTFPQTFTLAPLPTLAASGFPITATVNNATVEFSVAAAGATAWNWNFGDNPGGGPNGDGYTGWTTDPINGPAPSHTYAAVNQAGYTVTVQVRNCVNLGPSTSAPANVPITQITPLAAQFQPGCTNALCTFSIGAAVPFTDSSTGSPTTWDYDWDGSGAFADPGHTSPVTSHVYSTAGRYTPGLRVHRGDQTSTYVYTSGLSILPASPPSISITGTTSGTAGTAYTYSAAAANCTPSPSGWTWNTGGGTGSSSSSSISITWASAASTTVSVTNSACSGATGIIGVSISGGGGGNTGGGNTLHASFTYSPSSPTAGQTVSFDGSASTGATGYNWFFGDGTSASGAQATHSYAQAGQYTVKLDVSAQSSACQQNVCINEATQTITVGSSGPPPTLSGTFTSPACTVSGSLTSCTAQSGASVTLSASDARGSSYAWDFGDGTTGSGPTVTHSWSTVENYTITLVVSGSGFTSGVGQASMVVTAPPPPPTQSVVLPWVAETRGALVQSCDLYLHNPGSTPLDVTLEFLKRGTPQATPPQQQEIIQPGQTLYLPDVVNNTFQQQNISGFVTMTVGGADVLPIVTSFNTVTQASGGQFGQTVPGLTMPKTSPAATTGQPTYLNLIGLDDNSSELAYFGITNPTSSTATYQVTLYDSTGAQIGTPSAQLQVAPFGQRQFQQEDIHNLFGITSETDYRIQIQNVSDGTLFPYGENVRLGSTDPNFITVGSTTSSTQYVVGAFSNSGTWQSDVVLANVTSQPMDVTLGFQPVGVLQSPKSPISLTLQPGQTQRLTNAISTEWNVNNVVGVISVQSDGVGGVYPQVQAESYNIANPANRFGQSMQAFAETDAASAGQGSYLVGLRQDATHLTTFWVYNPSSTDMGVYTIVYRDLSGNVLGTLNNVLIPPGRARQYLPAAHPLPSGGATNGFTVQVLVQGGEALAAAQVLTTSTGDPAYVQGAVR